MAKADVATRETPLERFDAPRIPTASMALEETPWLRESRGGGQGVAGEFLRVLDPAAARAQRDVCAGEARAGAAPQSAPSPGSPGGPPSPYMTLYLHGRLRRAPREFGGAGAEGDGAARLAAISRREATRGVAAAGDAGRLLLGAADLPQLRRRRPIPTRRGRATSCPRTTAGRSSTSPSSTGSEHSPLLKLQLALTLERMDRHEGRASWCSASVMDSAKTTRDEGTFWAPEDRAWLWYNDTHRDPRLGAAHAAWRSRPPIRAATGSCSGSSSTRSSTTGSRRAPPPRCSTRWRTTSKATGTLAVREEATVKVGQPDDHLRLRARPLHRQEEPDRVPGREARRPAATRRRCTVRIEKTTPGLTFASATWHFSTEQLPAEARGDLFGVERRYFRRVKSGTKTTLVPLARRHDDRRRRRGRGAALAARQGGGRVRPPARPAPGRARARSAGVGLDVGSRHLAATRRRATAAPTSSSRGCRPASTPSSTACGRNSPATFRAAPGPAAVDVRPGVRRLLGGREAQDRRRAALTAPAPTRARRPTSGTCRRSRSRRRRASPARRRNRARTTMSSTYQPSATVFTSVVSRKRTRAWAAPTSSGDAERLTGPGRIGFRRSVATSVQVAPLSPRSRRGRSRRLPRSRSAARRRARRPPPRRGRAAARSATC